MKFVLDQTFRPTFSGLCNQISMLDGFEYSLIQHLVLCHWGGCKTSVVECVSNLFIDIRMSIICSVPQKIKRRECHKQDKREDTKMESKNKKDSNAKKDWTYNEIPLLLVIWIHQILQHYKCGYVRHFELWNEWTFELLNFRMLDETCRMKVCEWEYRLSSNIRNSVQNFIQNEYQMLDEMLNVFASAFKVFYHASFNYRHHHESDFNVFER